MCQYFKFLRGLQKFEVNFCNAILHCQRKNAKRCFAGNAHKSTPCILLSNCACVTRAKADKQANGRLYFCEKQKNFTKSVCNGVKRLERVGKIAVHNVDKKVNYKKFQNR